MRASFILSVSLLLLSSNASALPGYGQDLDLFCSFVRDEYAYFQLKQTDWEAVCQAYRPRAEAAEDKEGLVSVLEDALNELYDHHAHLATSTSRSPRLVPTGAQLWSQWQEGRAVIKAVKPGSPAELSGVRPGMQVLAVGGQPIEALIKKRAPHYLKTNDPAAPHWALQSVLAGLQDDKPIVLTVRDGDLRKELRYQPTMRQMEVPLSVVRRKDGVGVIRFFNSLGDTDTVAAFDHALDSLQGVRALIIDLRDTPSGGVSSVARGVMGRLISEPRPYQMHELVSEERASGIRRRWVEYVMPRGATFKGPVAVLAGHWTGSMGEGIAIGLNAAIDAPVFGTPMAALLGALGERRLPTSGITMRIPTEKLFHVDGTPREAFLPIPIAAPESDSAVDAVVAYFDGRSATGR